MKITNVEDGKKKIYVQLNDVMMLMQLDGTIPVEVMNKIFSDVFIVTDENKFEFAEFVEPSTVEFFENCEWIPDFRHYRNMTEEEFLADGQAMADEMHALATRWNAMDEDTREKNGDVVQRYEQLEHKMHSTAEILWTKQGHRAMPFPIVPDYEGFKFAKHEGCPYIAQQGLNPLQILIFRIDGESLDEKRESFPQGMIQAVESVLVNDNLEHNEYFGDKFKRTRIVSDDGKYLVTTFKIVPPEAVQEKSNTKEDTNSPDTKTVDKPKSLAKRIKNWINRKIK